MTDRNAHSWVEVWFAGYGWLPFDPTPGRVLHQRASTATPDAEQLATDLKTSGLTGAASAAAAKYVATVLPNGRPRAAQVSRGHGIGPGGNGRRSSEPRRRSTGAASSAGCWWPS